MHRRLAIRGQVQGKGFRPWVWQQANSLGVVGWVRNTQQGVEIDLHGEPPLLDTLQALLWQAPSPARVEQIEVMALSAAEAAVMEAGATSAMRSADTTMATGLRGTQSRSHTVGADLGQCARCQNEMLTPGNRRWRPPFTHCSECGPRYGITRGLPMDRGHTSMAAFAPCEACVSEAQDHADRRHQLPSNTCPHCGPRLWLRQLDGSVERQDPIASAARLLREGAIVAIKGWGGFQLYVDARNPTAVERLRQRKGVGPLPLGLMLANPASGTECLHMSAAEQRHLQSAERPMVLLMLKQAGLEAFEPLRAGLSWLGVSLPATPVELLLCHEAMGRPAGTDWLQAPVNWMLATTSGHAPGSPVVMDNETALLELGDMADAWLLHDLDIQARHDVSVLRVREDGSACFMRRSRGYAPTPQALPPHEPTREAGAASAPLAATWASPLHTPTASSFGLLDAPPYASPRSGAPSVLGLGALNRVTLTITQGDRALMSPHIGDLSAIDTRLAYTRLADVWPSWLATQPDALACDLHPDYFSTLLAVHLTHTHASSAHGVAPLPLIQVQHHHAHVAAVLAEHSEEKAALNPVLGLVLDGHGLGADGMPWGGELLRVQGDEAQRVGHLRPMSLPGLEQTGLEPWRMAAALLQDLGRADEIHARFGAHPQAALLQQWLKQTAGQRGHTTGLGRLFDAAAGLMEVLPLLQAAQHDSEAAMRLESIALQAPACKPLPHGWRLHEDMVLDWRPLMQWLADESSPEVWLATPDKVLRRRSMLAAVFHATLIEGLVTWAWQACEAQGLRTVVLAGGCLTNRLLDEGLYKGLSARGLIVWRPQHYPCGDGGLSLGQAWVARQRLLRQQARA